MYSVEEIKELLKAFDESKATKLAIQDANGERLTITQKTETAIVSPATEQPAAAMLKRKTTRCLKTATTSTAMSANSGSHFTASNTKTAHRSLPIR